jgi:hypothetical protein
MLISYSNAFAINEDAFIYTQKRLFYRFAETSNQNTEIVSLETDQ